MEMAEYLKKKLPANSAEKYREEHGLWAWLALLYFDQLRGKKTSAPEHYIPGEWDNYDPRVGYRHCIRSPLRLLERYEPEFARFCISKKMDTWGAAAESCVSRKTIMRSKKLRNTILALYKDPQGFPKTGMDDKDGPATIRRFASPVLGRVQATYDTEEMEPEKFFEIWGDEGKDSRFLNPSSHPKRDGQESSRPRPAGEKRKKKRIRPKRNKRR